MNSFFEQVITVGFLLVLTGCQSVINYDSVRTVEQNFSVGKFNKVIVECYCLNATVIKSPVFADISLKITGNYSIGGYHGSRQDAGAHPVSDIEIQFKKIQEDKTLSLISKEWIAIHHALLIDKLEIFVPNELEVEIKKIPYNELHSRNID